jgi:hypothetical protein
MPGNTVIGRYTLTGDQYVQTRTEPDRRPIHRCRTRAQRGACHCRPFGTKRLQDAYDQPNQRRGPDVEHKALPYRPGRESAADGDADEARLDAGHTRRSVFVA